VLVVRRLVKIGTSSGVTFPSALLRERGLKRGDSFLLELEGDAIVLRRVNEADVVAALRASAGNGRPRRRGR
jgi:antitoxin component of MazEF toxin-antitoxin module